MDQDTEAEFNRFVRIGMITVAVFAALGWYMRNLAEERMRPPGLAPPSVRTLVQAAPPGPDSGAGRIQRWASGPPQQGLQ
jgi:hypothetical protein